MAVILVILVLLLVLLVLGLTISSSPVQPPTEVLGEIEAVSDKAKAIEFPVTLPWLSMYGVDQTGTLTVADLTPCLEGLITCFGQNPSSPYLRPLWKRTTTETVLDQYMGLFDLKRTGAVVLAGLTPPPCTYYGFTPYLFRKEGEEQVLFSSIADTVNLFDFPESSRFNAPFAIVFSANIPLAESLTMDLLKTIPSSNVKNVPVLPWGGPHALLARVNGFASPEDEQSYLANPQTNVSVVKGNGYFEQGPFVEEVAWKPRATEWNEFTDGPGAASLQSVTVALEDVLSPVVQRDTWVPVPTELFRESIGYDTGEDCIAANVSCQGDNRDTVYRNADLADFTVDSVAMIVGVNHVMFGKAVTTNLSVYDTDRELGLFSSDITSPAKENNIVILSKRGFEVPEAIMLMNPICLLIPEEVQNVTIVERAYVQPRGNHNISAAPQTLIPYTAQRSVLNGGSDGYVNPGMWQVSSSIA